jgi:hypothetical protein
MFEQCIKLAAENKITDKNVWQLDLIQHLPSIVQAGQAAGLRGGGGFNFQKMSGGLDAGVTIYSKRVDTTYKDVFQQLHGIGGSKGDLAQLVAFARNCSSAKRHPPCNSSACCVLCQLGSSRAADAPLCGQLATAVPGEQRHPAQQQVCCDEHDCASTHAVLLLLSSSTTPF